MSVIKIKRSGAAGSPSSLGQGELAYSYLAGTQSNGGDRLYIGTGTETGGNAANIEVIGGKYFTEKLDHTPGTLTANSAIVVDSNSKIDVINVDDITIDGSTISSGTDLTIDANGSISVSSSKITDLGTPTANTDAATKLYVDQQVGAVVSDFTITGDSGTDTFETGQTLAFTGNTGITTSVSNNQVDIYLDDTGVIPGTYGSTTEIPVFIVDEQGRLTDANTVSISTDLNIAGDSGTDTVSLATETLSVFGQTGITTSANSSGIYIDLDDTTVAAGTYGNTTAIPVFTVDAQGRLTSANTVDVATQLSISGDSGTDTIDLLSETLDFAGGTGITTSVTGNTVTITGDDATTTTKGIASFDSNDFNVTSGAVELEDTVVKTITTDSGALTPATHGFSILGGEGIDVTHSTTTITVAGEDANNTNKGIASFSATNFTVTSGAVSSKDITIGNTEVTLGETITTISGLTTIDVSDLRLTNNTLSATDVNGNITLAPNGIGFVSVDNSLIKQVSDPIDPTDAANKRYVDEVAQGLQIKGSVEAATVADLNGTYDNGNNGIGATITLANTATLDIDGWTSWSEFDGILVKDQTNAEENGRYFVSTVGNTSTDWVLTRCTACDEKEEIIGAYVFVSHGTTYEATGWVATVANTDSFVVGTSDIDWVQFSGAGTYLAGDGLAITGTTFSVNVDDSSIEIDTDTLRVKALGITDGMLAGSISNSKLTNSTITIAGDTGNNAIDLGDTLTITGNNGIVATVSGDTIDLALQDEVIQDIIGNIVVEGEGINVSYDDANNEIIIAAELASTTNPGVASFSNTNFSVDGGGEVTIVELDGGTY